MEPIELTDEGRFRPRAQDLFVDREDQSVAFRTAILEHEHRVRAGEASIRRPRANTMVFHGVGGIGKSRLTKFLKAWVDGDEAPPDWGPPPVLDRPLRTTRVDLANTRALNAERLVLRLRAEVGDVGLRPDAFDIGLAVFWQLAYPGRPYPNVTSSRVGGRLVGEQIHDSLAEILQDEVGLEGLGMAGALIRGLRAAYNVTMQRRSRIRGANCPDLPTVLRAMHDEADLTPEDVVHLAPLLHWDLQQVNLGERPQLIVFLDTYEWAQVETSVDDHTVRNLVYYLPEVLFVISGRNGLRWHEPQVPEHRTRTGPDRWPGLMRGFDGEPRQHLLGGLSDSDADSFLTRFRDAGGEPLLSGEARARVVDLSHGLPFFLDLCVDTAIDIHRAGGEVTPDAFAESHPAVVPRVVRDLDDTGRRLLRFACLMPSWDVDLLHRASGVEAGRIGGRFLQRAFVQHDEVSVFGYRIHDLLRSSVLHEDLSMEVWNREDWREAGVAVLEALRPRCESADDPDAAGEAIGIGIDVASRTGVEADWLRLAAFRYWSLMKLAAALPPPASDAPETYGTHLLELIRCYGLPRLERPDALRSLAQSGRLEPILEASAWRHYAYRIGVMGDGMDAAEVFADLVERFEFSRELHRHQQALHLVRAGRLRSALELADSVLGDRRDRILASIATWEGRLLEAIEGMRRRAAALEERGDHRVAGENRRGEMFWMSMLDPGMREAAAELRATAERLYGYAAAGSATAAQMLCAAGDEAEVARLSTECEEYLLASDPNAPQGRRLLALGFHYAAKGDADSLTRVAEELPGVTNSPLYRLIIRFWVEELGVATGPPERTVEWIDDPAVVAQRWASVIRARRETLGLT